MILFTPSMMESTTTYLSLLNDIAAVAGALLALPLALLALWPAFIERVEAQEAFQHLDQRLRDLRVGLRRLIGSVIAFFATLIVWAVSCILVSPWSYYIMVFLLVIGLVCFAAAAKTIATLSLRYLSDKGRDAKK